MPHGWATSGDIESYTVVQTSEPQYPGATSIAVDASEQVVVGASIYSLGQNAKIDNLHINGKVTGSVWCGAVAAVSSSSGEVKTFSKGMEVQCFTVHAGAANGLAAHPSGKILASVGVDKSFVFYDISNERTLTQVFSDAGSYS